VGHGTREGKRRRTWEPGRACPARRRTAPTRRGCRPAWRGNPPRSALPLSSNWRRKGTTRRRTWSSWVTRPSRWVTVQLVSETESESSAARAVGASIHLYWLVQVSERSAAACPAACLVNGVRGEEGGARCDECSGVAGQEEPPAAHRAACRPASHTGSSPDLCVPLGVPPSASSPRPPRPHESSTPHPPEQSPARPMPPVKPHVNRQTHRHTACRGRPDPS